MEEYSIRIKKGDFELEIKGDKLFVEKKFEELYSRFLEEELKRKVEQKSGTKKERKKTLIEYSFDPEDLKEYFKNFNLPTHTEKMLVAARYLRDRLDKKSFTLSDLKNIYKIMRWNLSKNPSVFLAKFKKKKLIYLLPQKRDGKPLYMLTEEGIEFTERLKR